MTHREAFLERIKEKNRKINLYELNKAGRNTTIRAEMRETSEGIKDMGVDWQRHNIAKQAAVPRRWETGLIKQGKSTLWSDSKMKLLREMISLPNLF